METDGVVGNLYEALGVTKDATATKIRKAYLALAVQLHPDKNADDPKAKDRFQTLQKVYNILSDPEKRAVYDRTGSIEASEELGGEQFKDLYDYYRAMHAPVTKEAIDDFAASYQGSDEEKADVVSYYQKFKGDMNQVFQWVILSDPEIDSVRFMEYIEEALSHGKVTRFQRYTKWTKKISKLKSRRNMTAENESKKKNTGTKRSRAEEKEIAALMVKREGAFHDMLSAMASKYGVKSHLNREEPSEEEFEAARKRIEQRRSKK